MLLGPKVASLPSFYFTLYSKQGRLVPLSFAVQYLSITPPDKHRFPHLPGQAVSGVGSDFGPVPLIFPLVCSGLVLQNERSRCSCSIPSQVFFASGVQVTRRFSNVNPPLLIWAQLAFYLIVDSTSSTTATLPLPFWQGRQS